MDCFDVDALPDPTAQCEAAAPVVSLDCVDVDAFLPGTPTGNPRAAAVTLDCVDVDCVMAVFEAFNGLPDLIEAAAAKHKHVGECHEM